MATSRRSFAPFFRGYTKTWVHAVATAALTTFGMLTFVHRGFAVVAVASYVLPPLVIYLSGRSVGPEADASARSREVEKRSESAANGENSEGAESDSDSDTDTQEPARWTTVETPTDATLFDATITDTGAYAVGEDGIFLSDSGGDSWEAILEDGPGASRRALRGVDATDDGRAVWMAGDRGALGRLDTESGRHADHSAPADRTDSWTDLAVAGPTGEETLLLANSSGEVLHGQHRDGELVWDTPTNPGSGSSLVGAEMVSESVGYCCDTNSSVFETTDSGQNFDKIGLDGADGTLTAITAPERGDCLVTDDSGVCHRYDGANWTPTRLGDESLWAVAGAGETRIACGNEGVVYEREGGTDWERTLVSANGTLRGAAVGTENAVVVGEGGTVVERTT